MIEIKQVKKTIYGIGEIDISVPQVGESWHLKEIDNFVMCSEESFHVLAISTQPKLKNAIFLQRAVQAFVYHIQAGGEKQTANLLRSHFRNWLNRLPEHSLKIIFDGKNNKTTTGHIGKTIEFDEP